MSDVKKGVMIVRESNQNLGLAKKVSSKKPTDSDAIDKVSELSQTEFIKAFCKNAPKMLDADSIQINLFNENLTELIDKISFETLWKKAEELVGTGKIVLNLKDDNSNTINLIFHDDLFTSACIGTDGKAIKVVDTPIDDPSSVIFKFRDGTCKHLGHKYTYSNLEKIIQAIARYIDGNISTEEFIRSLQEKKGKLNETLTSLGLSKKVSSSHSQDESRALEDLALIQDLDTIVDLLIASYKKISTVKTTITTPSMADSEVREVWFKNDSWDSVFTVVVKISNHFYTTQTKATPQIYIRQEARHDVCAWLEKNIPQEYQLNKNSFEWAVLSRESPVYSNAEERNGLPFFIIEKFAEAINDYFTPSKVIESSLGIVKKTRDQARDIDTIDNVGIIPFEDPEIARVCHEHGVYTYDDAAKVTSIKRWFAEPSGIVQHQKYKYKKFNEFKYFTGIKTIGECAFWDCEMLEEIVIPKNVTRLEFGAFNGCVSLKHLHLPEKLKGIDMYSLNCENLESVNIPDSVEYISSWAFLTLSKNMTVYISKDHKMYYDQAFANCKKMDPSEEPLHESSLGLAKKTRDKAESRDPISNISEFIDLGLPSGNLWARCNIGALSETDNGDYIFPRDVIDLKNKTTKAFGEFHIPTRDDFREILNTSNCTREFIEVDGIPMMKVTSLFNEKSVMFPLPGYKMKSINGGDLFTSSEGEFGFYLTKPCDIAGNLAMSGLFIQRPLDTPNIKRLESIRLIILNEHIEGISVRAILPGKVNESRLSLAKKTREQASGKNAIDNMSVTHGIEETAEYLKSLIEKNSGIPGISVYIEDLSTHDGYADFDSLKVTAETDMFDLRFYIKTLDWQRNKEDFSIRCLFDRQRYRVEDFFSCRISSNPSFKHLIIDSNTGLLCNKDNPDTFRISDLDKLVIELHNAYYDTLVIHKKHVNESRLGLAKKVSEEDKDREAIDTVATLADLGLPSGNLWSTVNVGSSCTEEPGDFLTFDDAIQAAKGYGRMHVPTKKDFEELRSRCEQKTVTFNGIKGIEFTGSNGNKLFFPYFGYQSSDEINHGFQKECDFWTSTIDPRYPGNAYGFEAGQFRNIDCSSQTSWHNKKFRFQVRLVKPVEDINEADLSIVKKSKNKVNEANLGLAKKSREKAETKTEEETIQEFGEISPDQFMKCLYDYAEKDLKIPRDKLTMTSVEDDSFEYVEFSIELRNDKGLDFLVAKRAKPYGKDGHGNEDLVGWFGIMRYDFIEGTSSPLTLAFSYKSPEWCNADGAMANYPTVYPCQIEVLQLAKELIKKRL